MNKIEIIIKDHSNYYQTSKTIDRKTTYYYNNNDTTVDLIRHLGIEEEYYRFITDSSLFNIYDFLYTEEGIVWNVPINDARIADIHKTFPNGPIEITLNEDGLGSASGWLAEFTFHILKELFIDILLDKVKGIGRKALEQSRNKSRNRDLPSIEEIDKYLKDNSEIHHPLQFYRSIYNWKTWDLEELSELHDLSKNFCSKLLVRMGYHEINNSEVFKLDEEKKKDFLRYAEVLENEVIRKI